MALDEFECLVVGSDPAGLWLLGQMAKSLPEKNRPRLGWIDLGHGSRDCFLPERVAEAFKIPATEPFWSPEILTPNASLIWSEAGLAEHFPELPFARLRSPLEGRPSYSLAQQMIRRYPELLGYASGLWKVFGRARTSQPETVLLGALACTQVMRWNPADSLPSGVERIVLSPKTHGVEEIRPLRQGGVSLKLKEMAPLLTKNLVFNASFLELGELFEGHPELYALLNLGHAAMPSERAHYGFTVAVEKNALPCTLRPLTLLFDVAEIPDWESEVWPFSYQETETAKELRLWVTGPRPISLEALQDRLREGVKRLNHLFPFLAQSTLSFEMSLGMETCSSPEIRQAALGSMERLAVESYQLSTLDVRTRMKNLWVLGPFVQCHLPYPWGGLSAAQTIAQEWLKKNRIKPVRETSVTADTA